MMSKKDVLLGLLKQRFSEIEFEDFERFSLKSIEAVYKVLRYFRDEFGDNIFRKLNAIKAKEDDTPLALFSPTLGCIKLSLKLFGEKPDQFELLKWTYPERIFIHELIHYLLHLAGLSDNESDEDLNNQPLINLRKFVSKNRVECTSCCPNLTLKIRIISDIPTLTEEFICEVVSIYLNNIIRNPDVRVEDIFSESKIKYCIEALRFYEELKLIIREELYEGNNRDNYSSFCQ